MEQNPPYWQEEHVPRWEEGRTLADIFTALGEPTSEGGLPGSAGGLSGAAPEVAAEAARRLTAIFHAQVARAAHLLDAPLCALYLAEPAHASDAALPGTRARRAGQDISGAGAPGGLALYLRALYGAPWSQEATRLGMRTPPGGPATQALSDQAPLLSERADTPALNEWARAQDVRRWLYVPIVGLASLWPTQSSAGRHPSGRLLGEQTNQAAPSRIALGVLAVGRATQSPEFSAMDTRLLSALSEQLALAIENARLSEQVSLGHELARRYQEVLTAAERRERVLGGLNEGVLLIAPNGQVIQLNAAGRALLGWARATGPFGSLGRVQEYEPVEMRNVLGDVLHIEDWPMFRAMRGERFSNVEARYLGPDLHERLLIFNGRPLLDDKGRLEYALLNFHEASGEQMARAELEQMVRLADQRAHYVGAVLEAMTDGVIVCNHYGVLLLVNPAGKRMLETDQVRLLPGQYHLSRFVSDFQVRAVNDQPLAVADFPLMQALRGETVHDVVVLLRRPDNGHEWQAHISASPVRERVAGAPVIGAVAVMVDVTQARALDQAKDEFLALSAHELRGPLTSIRGFAQLLRRGTKQAPDGLERRNDMQWLEKIEAQADRLGHLIEELTDAARADLGKFDLHLRLVPLGALLRRVAEAQQVTTERHKVVADAPATGLFVHGDETRLEQVFSNLVANAIKYSPAGGDVSITVRDVAVPESSAPLVEVSIHDQGQGIAPADLERIFTRFTRADPEHHAQGLGLGLYIARAIIEAHGGRIWAESKGLGQSSTFIVRLPREGRG